MRNVIIGLCIAGLFLELSGLIWSSRKDKPSEVFLKLTEPIPRAIENPLENGYFLLLGFASAPGSDPVQVGYEIWLESDARPTRREFDLDKPGRGELRIPIPVEQVLPEWSAADSVQELQRRDALFRTSVARYAILLDRYERWLRMRFEDWGYAHRGAPPVEELLAAHRLYVAGGFAQQSQIGMARLAADVIRWRMVLREARTAPLKVLAQVMVEDDVQWLSRLVSRPAVDRDLLNHALTLLQPLTPSEYSLRWPVQSEFVLGYRLAQEADRDLLDTAAPDDAWPRALAQAAHVQPDIFRRVQHPRHRSLLGMSSMSQRQWDTYAMFYEATIKAAESIHSPLPKLRDVARDSSLTLLERLTTSADAEPNWEPLSQRLVETDARLRLASLQILLRKPSDTVPLATRLADVGSRYFDPFTGFPMLWSPTQKKLYSVGKDGLDDGGDPTFDISVPLAMEPSLTPAGTAR